MSPDAAPAWSRPPSPEPVARPHHLADVAAPARARPAPDLRRGARPGAEDGARGAEGRAAAPRQAQVSRRLFTHNVTRAPLGTRPRRHGTAPCGDSPFREVGAYARTSRTMRSCSRRCAVG